jgi:hypothetical protein
MVKLSYIVAFISWMNRQIKINRTNPTEKYFEKLKMSLSPSLGHVI